jgi:hypothetical protein
MKLLQISLGVIAVCAVMSQAAIDLKYTALADSREFPAASQGVRMAGSQDGTAAASATATPLTAAAWLALVAGLGVVGASAKRRPITV